METISPSTALSSEITGLFIVFSMSIFATSLAVWPLIKLSSVTTVLSLKVSKSVVSSVAAISVDPDTSLALTV